MEIDFEWESWRPAVNRKTASPDWHALRTRLHAAYEARRVMRGRASSQLDASGSFAPGVVRVLNDLEMELTTVNPTASANCKSPALISLGGDVDAFPAGDQRESRVK